MDRPPAEMWEQALIKTNDLKLQCSNGNCEQKWFIYNNTVDTRCPFCETKYSHSIPVLDFFYLFRVDTWKPDNMRLVVYNQSTFHKWHVNRNIIRNEKIKDSDKEVVGYFAFHNNAWVFVNQKLNTMKDLTEDKPVPMGQMVKLENGKKLLLSSEEGGRVAVVSLANT